MSHLLSEEQEMLREAARGFCQNKAPIAQLRSLRDQGSEFGFDPDTWREMAEMGWSGILVPEEYDGVAMGHRAAGLIMEEMGRTLTGSPFLSSAIMGATGISQYGTDEQKQTYLSRIASGETIIGVAVDEGRKHAPTHVELTAARSGNGFLLNGQKQFVADCASADAYIVSARTAGKEDEAKGISLFLVPKTQNGVSHDNRPMIDSRNAGTVSFDNVALDADALLGEVDEGAGAWSHILDAGRAGLAAEMSGAAQESLHRTIDYLQQRQQFGRTIGSFQSLQHRAAHLYSEIELGKSIVWRALSMMDEAPQMAGLMVSAAKAKLGQVAQLAAQESIQMHGGIGMTDEFDIGFFIKRIRVADALYGDHHFHAERYAQIRGF